MFLTSSKSFAPVGSLWKGTIGRFLTERLPYCLGIRIKFYATSWLYRHTCFQYSAWLFFFFVYMSSVQWLVVLLAFWCKDWILFEWRASMALSSVKPLYRFAYIAWLSFLLAQVFSLKYVDCFRWRTWCIQQSRKRWVRLWVVGVSSVVLDILYVDAIAWQVATLLWL